MSNIDKAKIGDTVDATVTRNAGQEDSVLAVGVYSAECYAADGSLKWSDKFNNLTTNVGRQDLLQKYFITNAGPGTVVMGLKGTGTAAVGDTQALHAGWLEVGAANLPYYSGTRKTPTFTNPVSTTNPAVLSTSTAVVFTMTGTGTVAGAFINVGGSNIIDNNTGVLFSVGDFTLGPKSVTSGDTINVTYTLSAS
jgi:hypothetical protein